MNTTQVLDEIKKWCNDNSGFLSLIVFFAALIIAWVSGFLRFLWNRIFRKGARFKITTIPGPTFSCTFPTGAKYSEYDVTRTFFALYLEVANISSAPASLETVELGYKWSVRIPVVSLEEARRYNREIGVSLDAIKNK